VNGILNRFLALFAGDPIADRAVPPTGYTARLTLLTSGAMAFLAVFALALSLATGRLADRWSAELAKTSTLRISAPQDQMEAQTQAALSVLQTTPGVALARPLSDNEQRDLLAPWFGGDLPIETLPVPKLIEIFEEGDGYDVAGLRARLAAEVPGAVIDDHRRWREPLVEAASRLRLLGFVSMVLIAAATAAMITLAANAALSANAQVIRVLRLVGARDIYIAQAFVRRFTQRALFGAAVGTVIGALAVLLLPSSDVAGGFLTGLGFQGWHWLLLLIIPILAAVVAFAATRIVFAIPAIFSRRAAIYCCRSYCWAIQWLASWMIGLKCEVRGTPPQDEVLIAAKHQSFLDVLMIYGAIPTGRFIMKDILKYAPIVGQFGLRVGCIPVKRGKRGTAIKKMVADVAAGRMFPGQLIIYPQGTRIAPGVKADYKIGTGVLYKELEQDCVPVAGNVGVFWPKRGIYRAPGLAVMEFLPRIPAGQAIDVFMEQLEQSIETKSNALMREAGFTAIET